jgi:hypothetical protein
MSNWHGGKGSKRRKSNEQAYRDNYDKIFNKGAKMVDREDAQQLMIALETCICYVEYTSLNNGGQKEREMTCCPRFIPSGNGLSFNQKASQMDKCLAYDIEFQRWDDIDLETITDWYVIQEDNFEEQCNELYGDNMPDIE